MVKKQALIFDFDGLIIDTESAEVKAWRKEFEEVGLVLIWMPLLKPLVLTDLKFNIQLMCWSKDRAKPALLSKFGRNITSVRWRRDSNCLRSMVLWSFWTGLKRLESCWQLAQVQRAIGLPRCWMVWALKIALTRSLPLMMSSLPNQLLIFT